MGESESKVRVRGSAVILDAERRVLLVRQFPDSDFWLLPGGGAEPGELSREAAVREVREETGLDVVCERLLWMSESMQHLPGRFVHHIDACYLARVRGSAGTRAEHQWGWFAREAPPSENLGLPPDFWDAVARDFREHDPGARFLHHRDL